MPPAVGFFYDESDQALVLLCLVVMKAIAVVEIVLVQGRLILLIVSMGGHNNGRSMGPDQ